MPEATSNVEFAHKIHEQGHHHGSPSGSHAEWVEILEAVVLAIVAIATAWSGYQASRWGALSAENYSRASRTTVLSQEKATLAGQDRLYDIGPSTVGSRPRSPAGINSLLFTNAASAPSTRSRFRPGGSSIPSINPSA